MILITDTQYLTNQSLQSLLFSCGHEVRVVATREELLVHLKRKDVKLIIIDYVLFDFKSITDLVEIRKLFSDIPVLILTGTISQMQIRDLNNAGIGNISLKVDGREELLQAVDAALRRKKHYSEGVLEILLKKDGPIEPSGVLTRAETDIVRQIASGLTTKEIAAKKQISFHTVMTHRKNIFRKLGISNSSELVMFAIKSGMIKNIEYHI
ncbi:MAG: response regulator transcription factor [Chlorobiaceae bacterium]|nr:response regulator transcription factor [Chlorobiaceae bacterium]NTW75080.1 response regulator transcription factor [Chlorobiaceae bacterium]